MAAIDWHTNEMAKHWEIAKETQCMQRQFNDCLYKLLQEMEYQQVVEVGELSDKESTGMETSDGETDVGYSSWVLSREEMEGRTRRRERIFFFGGQGGTGSKELENPP
ncbi:hypothetical protein EDC04DRAFT_2898978 [Pisolithus marmoratus]|nr:hypothetical protein EDC04DRAFT_2898978 [Pisolithus marmoratus]